MLPLHSKNTDALLHRSYNSGLGSSAPTSPRCSVFRHSIVQHQPTESQIFSESNPLKSRNSEVSPGFTPFSPGNLWILQPFPQPRSTLPPLGRMATTTECPVAGRMAISSCWARSSLKLPRVSCRCFLSWLNVYHDVNMHIHIYIYIQYLMSMK